MASDLKKQAQNIVRQALEKLLPKAVSSAELGTATGDTDGTSGQTTLADDLGPDALIDLYFDCDDADERDVVFERIASLEQEKTNAFFEAMMQNDEDEYMRVAAAELLAVRGNEVAKQVLYRLLEEQHDTDLFEQVLDALVRIDPEHTKLQCQQIFYNRDCDFVERRIALLVLESFDVQAALICAQKFIADLSQPEPRHGDLLELTIGVLVRTPVPESQALLEACMQRMQEHTGISPDMDQDDQEAWLALLEEGLSMLHSALAPT